MRTSSYLSLVSVIVAIGCAAPPKEAPADETEGGSDAVSADGAGDTSAAPTSTAPAASSTAATSPDPSKVTVPPLPGGATTTPGLPAQPPVGTVPANPPAPAAPPVDLNTCYGQCLSTKGVAILVFDACSNGCAEGDQACIDQCWAASGCEANEAECQNAYATCDAECPGDVGP